jgi:hypothetical protein
VADESVQRSVPAFESGLVSMTARLAGSHEIDLFSGGGRILLGEFAVDYDIECS